MKLYSILCAVALLVAPSLSFPVPSKRAAPDAATITALAPPLGFQSGLNPDGTGSCDGAVKGANGQPIKIPCSCPPAQAEYVNQLIANVQAGHALNNPSVQVSFPTDNSTQSQSARLNAASVTLQNLNGPGKGCPVVSTTFPAQQKAINSERTTPPASPPVSSPNLVAAPVPASSASSPASVPSPAAGNNSPSMGTPDPATISALAPSLGFHSGVNPTGTGDCDGAVKGANGQPVKVPCACPPAQDVYVNQLIANVQAGHALNNPTVGVSFPTDNSPQSQSTRITAALITLQNLNGPGKGCPAASTTLVAQQKALAG